MNITNRNAKTIMTPAELLIDPFTHYAFMRRALNRGVDDPDVLEAATGLGVYASIPHSDQEAQLSRSQAKGGGVATGGVLARRFPTDLAVESLRSQRAELGKQLREQVGFTVDIEVTEPGSLPASEGKAKRVIDERT